VVGILEGMWAEGKWSEESYMGNKREIRVLSGRKGPQSACAHGLLLSFSAVLATVIDLKSSNSLKVYLAQRENELFYVVCTLMSLKPMH
jgi:hypothetical protein